MDCGHERVNVSMRVSPFSSTSEEMTWKSGNPFGERVVTRLQYGDLMRNHLNLKLNLHIADIIANLVNIFLRYSFMLHH